jgi:hypothetical protein
MLITRDEVVARSYQWPERSIPYSMVGLYNGYRRDCSGYVSYCLGLPGPGRSTVDLPDVCTPIAAAQLRPGDLIGNMGPGTGGAAGHVQLFLGWTNTGLTIAEQAGGMDGPWHHDIKRITPGYGCWRYNEIVDVAPSPPTPSPLPKDVDMFRLIDPENGQFNIYPEALSPTGWAWTPIIIGDQDRMMVAGGVGTANGSANDPNHNPHANDNWRPGTFGPSSEQVRKQLIVDVTASVVAALPPSQGGSAPTLTEITAAVRAELDATKLGRA